VLARAVERQFDDGLGFPELARIGERVAQQGRVANLGSDVAALGIADLVEALLPERDSLIGASRTPVGIPERAVDLDGFSRQRAMLCDRLSQETDRARVVASLVGSKAERRASAGRCRGVSGRDRLFEDLDELRLGVPGCAEAQAQLSVGKPQLPCLDLAHVRPGLEVGSADAELGSELP
jgi:hypothetical protein